MSTITGIFDNKFEANRAVAELLDAKFSKDNISILVSDKARDTMFTGTDDEASRAVKGGAAGATIGGVAGGFGLNIDPFALIGGRSLTGVVVGSRAMTQSLVKFIDENALVPVIDSVFSFDQAANAYQRMEHGRPIGKVVIAID